MARREPQRIWAMTVGRRVMASLTKDWEEQVRYVLAPQPKPARKPRVSKSRKR